MSGEGYEWFKPGILKLIKPRPDRNRDDITLVNFFTVPEHTYFYAIATTEKDLSYSEIILTAKYFYLGIFFK